MTTAARIGQPHTATLSVVFTVVAVAVRVEERVEGRALERSGSTRGSSQGDVRFRFCWSRGPRRTARSSVADQNLDRVSVPHRETC
jgi:hypothetical protein